MNNIKAWCGRSAVVAALAAVFLFASGGTAFALKGQGYPCTSGWPTNYQCERFEVGGQGSVQLWSQTDGYCFLVASDITTNGTGDQGVFVSDIGNWWTLQSGGPGNYGSAMCITYPGYNGTAKQITDSQPGGKASHEQIGPNKAVTAGDFCSLAGYKFVMNDNLSPNFEAAYNEYPATKSSAKLHEWVQNGQLDETVYSQCLAISSQTWWGNTSYSKRKSGQTVFIYNFTDSTSEYVIPDLPALNSVCMFTSVYAPSHEGIETSLDVIDETGTWGVYVHSASGGTGSATAQVACIIDNGP
jgi:hypothetical protein